MTPPLYNRLGDLVTYLKLFFFHGVFIALGSLAVVTCGGDNAKETFISQPDQDPSVDDEDDDETIEADTIIDDYTPVSDEEDADDVAQDPGQHPGQNPIQSSPDQGSLGKGEPELKGGAGVGQGGKLGGVDQGGKLGGVDQGGKGITQGGVYQGGKTGKKSGVHQGVSQHGKGGKLAGTLANTKGAGVDQGGKLGGVDQGGKLGGVDQGSKGITQGGVYQGGKTGKKSGVHQGVSQAGKNGGPSQGKVGFGGHSNDDGYDDAKGLKSNGGGESAPVVAVDSSLGGISCTHPINYRITHNNVTYTLNRYVTTYYADELMFSGEQSDTGFTDFATILFSTLYSINESTLGQFVVRLGELLDPQRLVYEGDSVLYNGSVVASVVPGHFSVSRDHLQGESRNTKFDLVPHGGCLALYQGPNGGYLGNQTLALVLP